MSTIPPDFHLPAEMLPAASELRRMLDGHVAQLAEQVEALGLPNDQANTIVVDWLIDLACLRAMAVAIAYGRSPSRSRWQEVTGEKFDRNLTRFSGLLESGEFS